MKRQIEKVSPDGLWRWIELFPETAEYDNPVFGALIADLLSGLYTGVFYRKTKKLGTYSYKEQSYE
jgi:LPXTG-motif cell wall-anchored protein